MCFEKHCWAEIDLDALRRNFRLIRAQAAPAKVCAVLKADAYGHGDALCAQVLAEEGAAWFAVSCLAEALHLRRAGIVQPILVLGHTDPAQAPALWRHKITQAVYSPEYARALAGQACAAGPGACVQVHLKVDTGMGRIGFSVRAGLEEGVRQLSSCFELKGLVVTGLFQHFAVADSLAPADVAYTGEQHRLFTEVLRRLQAVGRRVQTAHCCNSAGLITHPEWGMDMVRAGIILYGQPPSGQVSLPGLAPVFALKAVVSQVKELCPGESVSYGRAFTAPAPMRVATLCAGYADGYPRLLSGQGIACLHGQPAPVLGRVCMDQLIVDVTHIPRAQSGDEATLFGGRCAADSAARAAEKAGTIPYELLCGVSRRVPRVYIQGGKVTAVADFLTCP